MHRIFCRISAIAGMILHLKPLAKHSQPCGTHPNGLNGTGRAKGSLNRRFKRRFCILFAAAGKKYAAGCICQPSKQVVRTPRTIRCAFVFLTCPQYCEKINSRNDNFFHSKMETFPVKTEKFCINCKLCEKVLYFFVESGN